MLKFVVKIIIVSFLILAIISIAFSDTGLSPVKKRDENMGEVKEAVFAGGCFWHMEYIFEQTPGVIGAVSGYTGGSLKNPIYEQVSTGNTGHYESVLIEYNPNKISYERLLEIFWKNINPIGHEIHNNNYGSQYETVIFYSNRNEKILAEKSKRRIIEANIFGRPVSTKILKRKVFYPAEDYHQNYYKKHPELISASGRGGMSFSDRVWLKHKGFRLFPEKRDYWIGYKLPSEIELKKLLTPIQYKITQKDGTEPSFNNEYWDNHEQGIYVDIVSGEPLFSSLDKFDSGSGWPSFTKPLESYNVVHNDLTSLGIRYTEVRSRYANSHLGHVFKEKTATGLRYCIDSAALRFISADELNRYGYEAYSKLFKISHSMD